MLEPVDLVVVEGVVDREAVGAAILALALSWQQATAVMSTPQQL